MKVSLIVAAAQNRTIGLDNDLPWHLPGDLQYFKKMTVGKPIIMGRKTWDSIKKPLPDRTNIVITRSKTLSADGIVVVHTIEDAITYAKEVANRDGMDEVMVVGGAGIYEVSLPYADRLYLTQIHADIEGDTFFPELSWNEWELSQKEDFFACEKNPYDYSFCVFEKKDKN